MSAPHGVVIRAHPRHEGALVEAIRASDEDLEVVRRCADMAEVSAAARSGVADLAVLDAADPDVDRPLLAELSRAGMRAVLIAAPDDEARARSLGGAGTALAGDPEQAVRALIAALVDAPPAPDPCDDPPTPPAPPTDSSLIAVWGTSGAPGRSSVAVSVAHALAKSAPTLLIDADTANPSVAHLLGLPVDVSGLSALSRQAVRAPIGPLDLHRLASPRSPGLDVLTGLTSPHRWREAAPSSLERILEAARGAYRFVVVDVSATSLDPLPSLRRPGGGRDDAALAVLAAADRVLVVARGDTVGINRLDHLAKWWEDSGLEAPLDLVVSRVSASSVGGRPAAVLMPALSSILPGRRVHLLPEESAVPEAALRGMAPAEYAPDCATAAVADALADTLM